MSKYYLGIGKTTHNSSATVLEVKEDGTYEWMSFINERLERKKYSGHWPLQSLLALQKYYEIEKCKISENRDITSPLFQEELLNSHSPFYELLKMRGLESCSSKMNKDILYVAHHPAHAYALLATLPFKASYLLVMDGGGSEIDDYRLDPFHKAHKEKDRPAGSIEHTSFYFWDGAHLTLLDQRWLTYRPSSLSELKFSDGIGSLYEKASQLIFNDPLASGKVMGLSGHGSCESLNLIDSYRQWQEEWLWDKRFDGKSKKEWQESRELAYWKSLACEVQMRFEEYLFDYLEEMMSIYQDKYGEHPLAMGGGCALNCSANFKLFKKKIFPEVYVSPFPGDESISLGTAFAHATNENEIKWKPRPWEDQYSNFSPTTGELDKVIEKMHIEYDVVYKEDEAELLELTADILKEGHVVAWFQGDSECGPRALGHRSLLARADRRGLKKYLNEEVKFREDFRPYGASVQWEESHKYFDVPIGFQNPFMSFATPLRDEYRELLKEVTHIDHTCRMQTVMKEQNPRYYKLLEKCRDTFGLGVLLNTSLNIMGEPILESYEDAYNFFNQTKVKYLVLENYLIKK